MGINKVIYVCEVYLQASLALSLETLECLGSYRQRMESRQSSGIQKGYIFNVAHASCGKFKSSRKWGSMVVKDIVKHVLKNTYKPHWHFHWKH